MVHCSSGLQVGDTPSYISSKDAYILIMPDRVEDLNKSHDVACASYMERDKNLTMAFKLMQQKKGTSTYEPAVISRGALEDWLAKDVASPRNKEPPSGSRGHPLSTSSSRQSSQTADVISEDFDRLESSPDRLASPVTLQRLDNSSIICNHGAQSDAMRFIRTDTTCYFDPEMTTQDICRSLYEKRYALDHSSYVMRFDEIRESDNTIEGAWVSKVWLKDWRQDKPKMHKAEEIDPAPDAPAYADHVPATYLQPLFPTRSPINSNIDHPRVSCSACNKELLLSKETRQELKQQVDREKERLRGITSAVELDMDPDVVPGVSQATVPAEFLRQWRAWISRPQENAHLRKLLSLVSLADWEILQNLYGGGPLIRVTGLACPSQGSEATSAVTHDFEVCQECRSERLSNFETAIIMVRMLGVELDPTEEDGLVFPVAQSHTPGKPLRTSSSLRRSKRRADRKYVTVRKSWTVKDIKMVLHDEFNIPTICQRLYFKNQELSNNLDTVASLGILANDTLELREEKENEDALTSDVEQCSREPREEGRAFGGTILSGGLQNRKTLHDANPNHCPVCTFINLDDLAMCSMYGSNTEVEG
ncbi:hypothetical protein JB92DRAFT_2983100 [Gautieria morchelliformis]|nr:hypothetical protein JB92DRAFT_2983100 [Gautieria morchelliformis]